jgi:acyl-CoA thioester hydrolase
MEKYSKQLQIRWSDIDQNRHLRHSVYYDFGAFIRIAFLSEHGLTTAKMEELNVGPVLFREEILFKREVKPNDALTIDVELTKSSADYSRWSLRHTFTRGDGTVAAVLNLDGAWMDLEKRKLRPAGDFISDVFTAFPKSADFEFINKAAAGEK